MYLSFELEREQGMTITKSKKICQQKDHWKCQERIGTMWSRKESLARAQDESTKISETITNAKSKVRHFDNCSLVDDLL